MGEIADSYRRRADAFDRKVAAVRPGQWDNPSPCEKWTARDVVRHIIDMHGVILRPLGRRLTTAPTVDEDPVAAFRSARADVEAILDDPSLASTACETPTGTMTIEEHIDKVPSSDLPLHGWDLARATGQDDTIDPADVAYHWSAITGLPADLLEKFRTPGAFGPGVEVFGPEVPIGEDASPQDRLLAFIGRDPQWAPW
ncbi:TIGR03086 family metal-binding protein [Nonomuraea soli]|uniref:Uncharacterized protein (TIGR03086 family) n=1 Tax=Nonomuraea soli TaxID=1032476 RepID=A0A7W0CQ98_9ACTN|nr:TIGR03086 family metal-binding protein [Nonomuraea soli]MBA2895333.1 uncharacterized protein (TIGR03086 family) [Nonomuraea soli]